MAHFDVDEYMTPLGEFEDIPSILRQHEHNDVDAVAFNDHVYGRCKEDNDASNTDSNKTALFQLSCFSGSRIDYKRKEVLKPDKVLYHHVHYSVASCNQWRKPRWIMLDDEREGKLTHSRWSTETSTSRDPQDEVVAKWIPQLDGMLSNINNRN
jgi:hypothetical protein